MTPLPSRLPARTAAVLATACAASLLAACAYQRPAPQSYPPPAVYQGSTAPQAPATAEYGRVSQIEWLPGSPRAQTTGGGAILGAVVGGLIGNQIGRGSGRAAATAVGAVGGAVAGNAIEERNQSAQGAYRLSIQLDRGGYRLYDVPSVGDLRVGDRVRVVNGQISRY
ncbi:glycine zipper 2TM domain-containing protein [Comamonas granuli]|uniref:glycine zipper 2TM domain-containing protein n=1 Tax=Comamonas granuli TaxID=290309 RepID=UPI003F6FBAB6